MEESEDTKSSEDSKIMPVMSSEKPKPKKRSLVERELETSLTEQFTSPLNTSDGLTKSRYGRARRLKTDSNFTDTDKAVTEALLTSSEKTPVKSPVTYKMHASNSLVTDSQQKRLIDGNLDDQIENIYNANMSLSRFSSEEKNTPSPAKKFSKVYTRKDLIQSKEKDEELTLIANYSPAKSAQKPGNSHLSNILERSSEKYSLNRVSEGRYKGHVDKNSVVKMLDFDSNKRKRKGGESRPILSKNELFELEAKCIFQVGDLAWARMGTFPFWPCIVTREPMSEMFVRKKLFGRIERDVIHVTFFGDNGRRSWILDSLMRPFLGLREFEAARDQFTPESKKKDPRLYAAFFVSDKKQALWKMSIDEAETLMREPKRLRIDIFYDMLEKSKIKTQKTQKSSKISRTDSDVSLSESLFDTLFSEDDGKSDDPEKSAKKSRNKSLDVSEVVTACLDNMAAKTGIANFQRQSHMDRWLQKAKSKTPEKNQFKVTVTVEKVDSDNESIGDEKKKRSDSKKQSQVEKEENEEDAKVDEKKNSDQLIQKKSLPNETIEIEKDDPKSDEAKKKPNSKQRKKFLAQDPRHSTSPYSFRKSVRESLNLRSNQNEHDYSVGSENSLPKADSQTVDLDDSITTNDNIGIITKVERLNKDIANGKDDMEVDNPEIDVTVTKDEVLNTNINQKNSQTLEEVSQDEEIKGSLAGGIQDIQMIVTDAVNENDTITTDDNIEATEFKPKEKNISKKNQKRNRNTKKNNEALEIIYDDVEVASADFITTKDLSVSLNKEIEKREVEMEVHQPKIEVTVTEDVLDTNQTISQTLEIPKDDGPKDQGTANSQSNKIQDVQMIVNDAVSKNDTITMDNNLEALELKPKEKNNSKKKQKRIRNSKKKNKEMETINDDVGVVSADCIPTIDLSVNLDDVKVIENVLPAPVNDVSINDDPSTAHTSPKTVTSTPIKPENLDTSEVVTEEKKLDTNDEKIKIETSIDVVSTDDTIEMIDSLLGESVDASEDAANADAANDAIKIKESSTPVAVKEKSSEPVEVQAEKTVNDVDIKIGSDVAVLEVDAEIKIQQNNDVTMMSEIQTTKKPIEIIEDSATSSLDKDIEMKIVDSKKHVLTNKGKKIVFSKPDLDTKDDTTVSKAMDLDDVVFEKDKVSVISSDEKEMLKRNLRSRTIKSPFSSIKQNGYQSSKNSCPVLIVKQKYDTISIKSSKKQKVSKDNSDGISKNNPEFLKYLELRQDTLIDEHPELTEDEIVNYLYKTWQYEENKESVVVKSEAKTVNDEDSKKESDVVVFEVDAELSDKNQQNNDVFMICDKQSTQKTTEIIKDSTSSSLDEDIEIQIVDSEKHLETNRNETVLSIPDVVTRDDKTVCNATDLNNVVLVNGYLENGNGINEELKEYEHLDLIYGVLDRQHGSCSIGGDSKDESKFETGATSRNMTDPPSKKNFVLSENADTNFSHDIQDARKNSTDKDKITYENLVDCNSSVVSIVTNLVDKEITLRAHFDTQNCNNQTKLHLKSSTDEEIRNCENIISCSGILKADSKDKVEALEKSALKNKEINTTVLPKKDFYNSNTIFHDIADKINGLKKISPQTRPREDEKEVNDKQINDNKHIYQENAIVLVSDSDDDYSDDDIERPAYSPHCPELEKEKLNLEMEVDHEKCQNEKLENQIINLENSVDLNPKKEIDRDGSENVKLENPVIKLENPVVLLTPLSSEEFSLNTNKNKKVYSKIQSGENTEAGNIKTETESDYEMSSELDNLPLNKLRRAMKKKQKNSKKEASATSSDEEETPKRNLRPRTIKSPFSSIKENGYQSSKDPSPVRIVKQEYDTISVNSEDSNTSTKQKVRKDKSACINMNNPEFLKYLEMRQDTLIDEHPELTQDEIVSYLYKTWQYEESKKSDIVKSEDIESSNLVKGVGESIPPKKKKSLKLKPKNDEIVQNDRLKETKLRDKRKNQTRPSYNEEFSDLEDEIEVFEIFKPKIKLEANEPQTSKTSQSVEPKISEIVSPVTLVKPSTPKTVTKAEPAKVKSETPKEPSIEVDDKEAEEPEYYVSEEAYFENLTKPKPNVFKGLAREKVCEICEKNSNLVKCKTCHCMFHIACNNIKTEGVEASGPTRGRKKKRGRKPKVSTDSNVDSGSQSDEKPLNTSDDVNMSVDVTIDPIVVDLDNFEDQLEVRMKDLVKEFNEIDYESYSSDDGIDWETSVAGKCEIVDVKLKPRTKPVEVDDFKCQNCMKYNTPICFVCKAAVSPKGIEKRQKCQVAHCNRYYHVSCLDQWPQTQLNSGEPSRNSKTLEHTETLTCPRHVCHTCVCDDPRGCKTRFSSDKLARCVRCPATYHSFTKCLPAGSQILSASHIICPRHYEHRPGKVPCHVNTGWCFICALGGTLICCEYCPTSFHADCLNIEPPEGNYMCEDCETGRLPLYGEMVWVKLGHYRWWPGIILHPVEIPDNIKAVKHSLGEFVVRFFGQYDHYWVNRGRVFPFQEGDSGRISSQKSKIDEAFTIAMEHAQRAFEILKNIDTTEEDPDIASSLLPPHFVKLKVNKPCGSLYGKKIDIEESSLTQCECNPDEEEPCGPYSHCLNRMLLTECGPLCRAGERCQNRAFERRQYPRLAPYRTPHRGWGLRTLEPVRAGQFVIEYVGELIDEAEFKRRMHRKHEIRDENFYFLTLDKERMIDAGPKGNLARFMNHCCEPNCETQKWTVLGDVRVGLFAIKDIPANSEVTFNYNLECAGIEKKPCLCGAPRCSGYIGEKPKQEEKESQPKKLKEKPIKRPYKKKKVDESPSTSKTKAKRPVGRPAKPRELTEIEKDLLIIKNATNGLSSDSEGSGRLSSVDGDKAKPLKRKRVSFSSEDIVMYKESPIAKKVKLDSKDEVGD